MRSCTGIFPNSDDGRENTGKKENRRTRIVRNWQIIIQMQAEEVLWKELIDPCIVTGDNR